MRTSRLVATRVLCLLLVIVLAAAASGENAETLVQRLGPAADAGSTSTALDDRVNFSFDQVDVSAFVKLVGELTGRKFVLAEGVGGKITVVSPQVRRAEVYPLFVSILESAGCSVVEELGVSRIVSLGARGTGLGTVVGPDEAIPERGVVTKIFLLKNVRASEVAKAIAGKPRSDGGTTIAAIEETNHLLVTDTAEAVSRVERLLAGIDKPGLSRSMEVVQLKFAAAEELASQLSEAMAQQASRADSLRRRLSTPGSSTSISSEPMAVASTHANSLLLVGTATEVEEMRRVVGMMDVDPEEGRGRFNAIFLKYLSAEEAAKALTALLERTKIKNSRTMTGREMAIEASKEYNALIVDASRVNSMS